MIWYAATCLDGARRWQAYHMHVLESSPWVPGRTININDHYHHLFTTSKINTSYNDMEDLLNDATLINFIQAPDHVTRWPQYSHRTHLYVGRSA
jgi:hypothetical protein